MGKISIQDLAQVLVERKGLNKRDAAIFVSAMFDIIQTNLEKDKIVKIKGLKVIIKSPSHQIHS